MSQVPAKTRDLCRLRDGGMCQRCVQGKPAQELQHRRARGMGSANRPHTHCPCNLVWLCSSCHRMVESQRQRARESGFAVTLSADEPMQFPIELKGVWHLLTCDGRKVRL